VNPQYERLRTKFNNLLREYTRVEKSPPRTGMQVITELIRLIWSPFARIQHGSVPALIVMTIVSLLIWFAWDYQHACPPDCRTSEATVILPSPNQSSGIDTNAISDVISEVSASIVQTGQATITWGTTGVSTIYQSGQQLLTDAYQAGQSALATVSELIPEPSVPTPTLDANAALRATTQAIVAAANNAPTTRVNTLDATSTPVNPSITSTPTRNQSPVIVRETMTFQLTESAVCWGAQIDGVGIPGNPLITTFVQMPRQVTVVDGGCTSDTNVTQQVNMLRQQYPNDNWQVIPADAPLAANAPAQQWDVRTTWHTPKAGDVCWGEGFGSENDRYGVQGRAIIVNFAADDIERYIEYGKCERNGRTFDQIARSLRANEPQRNWIDVPNLSNIRNQSPQVPRRWYMSDRGTTTVDANSVCWGTSINGYGFAGNPVIVGITQNNTSVDVLNGGCFTADLNLSAMTDKLRAELPYLNWQVVPSVDTLAQTPLVSRTVIQDQVVTLNPDDVCFVLGIKDTRSPYQSRFTYGTDQHGIVFKADAPATVFITYGICERNGRTYDQMLNSMRTYENNKQWVDAGNFSNIANINGIPHRWQSGPGEQQYSAQPGSICWGMQVGTVRNASNRVLVRFNQQWDDITVRDGQCELNTRSWPDTITWLTQEAYPDNPDTTNDDWWVVDDYAVYAQ